MGEAQDRAEYARGAFLRHLGVCRVCQKASGTRNPDADHWPCWAGQSLHEAMVKADHEAYRG